MAIDYLCEMVGMSTFAESSGICSARNEAVLPSMGWCKAVLTEGLKSVWLNAEEDCAPSTRLDTPEYKARHHREIILQEWTLFIKPFCSQIISLDCWVMDEPLVKELIIFVIPNTFIFHCLLFRDLSKAWCKALHPMLCITWGTLFIKDRVGDIHAR